MQEHPLSGKKTLFPKVEILQIENLQEKRQRVSNK